MVLFASLAALLGAVALVGWHRASLSESKSRRDKRQREALGELITPSLPSDTFPRSHQRQKVSD